MPLAANGDTLQLELLSARDILGPAIKQTRDYLTSVEDLYREDPILMRDLLWKCLDAMTTADQHVATAEHLRHTASPRRQAALEREHKKRIDYHD